mgnify:CR=1 FL=1
MKLQIIAILCIAIIFSSCGVTKKDNALTLSNVSNLTSEQWIEDINYLEKNLAEKHINVYNTITKEKYEKEFSDLKKEVPKLKEYEIKLKLAQIVASIGDAHTALNICIKEGDNIYPFQLHWFGDDLKIIAIDRNYKKFLGNTLIAVNNIPTKEVMAKINTLIPHENEQWSKNLNEVFIRIPEVLKFLNITKENKVQFTLSDDKGNITKLNLSPQIVKLENMISVKDSIAKTITMYNNDMNDYDNAYWYKYIPDDKIMYFQYNQCIDRYIAKDHGIENYEKYPDFNKFSDELIKELNDKEIDKFIIDLRYNGGGNSRLMTGLAPQLTNITKLNKKGKIFVLIGRETFSSAVYACTSLKESTKAIFVGEPTGGNPNCYGDILRLTLPNSKIQVSYSTKYFELAPEYKENFTPDIPIEQSYIDYTKGIDDVYEAARAYKN